MQVRDIMTHDPITLPPSAPVMDAFRIMSARNIGRIPIVQDGTDRRDCDPNRYPESDRDKKDLTMGRHLRTDQDRSLYPQTLFSAWEEVPPGA